MMVGERVGASRRGEESVSWGEAFLIGVRPGERAHPRRLPVRIDDCDRHAARPAARRRGQVHVPPRDPGDGGGGREGRRSSCATWRCPTAPPRLMAIGLVVSAAVGYLTIKYFLRFLAGHRLDVFAYYRWALAAATFVWLWRV